MTEYVYVKGSSIVSCKRHDYCHSHNGHSFPAVSVQGMTATYMSYNSRTHTVIKKYNSINTITI